MERSETLRTLTEMSARRADVSTRIVKAARPLIPVLLDASRANSAKDLKELFFELDAIEQEITSFVKADPQSAFSALIELIDAS